MIFIQNILKIKKNLNKKNKIIIFNKNNNLKKFFKIYFTDIFIYYLI